jgi:proline iminopeptidase
MLDLRSTIRQVATSAAGTYAAYVAHGVLHPALLRANAGLDARAALPGDELVPDPHWVTTFATRIHAPRDVVWPWLVQIGYGRAGWYTWYRWDNGGVASADRIVPELQDLAVGDEIPDGPRAHEGFGVWRVHTLARPSAMVLFSRRNPMTGREIAPDDRSDEKFIACSWAFALAPTAENECKLRVRVRARLERFEHARLLARGAHLLFGVGDTVMERTLLDGVRDRAERAHRSAGSHA